VLYWDGYYAQHTQSFVLICYAYTCIPVNFFVCLFVCALRSFMMAMSAVTKLLQHRCILMLLSSFNSKFLSKLIPPIFLFLMSSSRPLFSIPHFLLELRKDALLCLQRMNTKANDIWKTAEDTSRK